jgi:hypothetical protein
MSTTGLDLADIQGFILRGYTMPHLRCLALRVRDAGAARRFLEALVEGGDAGPRVTSAAPWTVKPDYCLNLGITADGLRALGLPEGSLASFPEEFLQGALGRAAHLGDTGPSAPEHWHGGFGTPGGCTCCCGCSPRTPGRWTGERPACGGCSARNTGRQLEEVSCHDAQALPDYRVHFGFRDSISQPNIEGGPWAGLDDPLPRTPPGAFLLGYPSQYHGFAYPVPSPPALGFNGSFAAFRILQQDVDGFEEFLRAASAKIGMHPEKLAAKMCGRWRNGLPLALSPDTDTPDPPIPWEKWNHFDYVPTDASPDSEDDRLGVRCPIGSHLRRANPRSARVRGSGGHLHRVVRRGMPYGPAFDPARPRDGVERGLLGVFINVSLKDQFEFLMREWVNDGTFAPGLGPHQGSARRGQRGRRRWWRPVPDPGRGRRAAARGDRLLALRDHPRQRLLLPAEPDRPAPPVGAVTPAPRLPARTPPLARAVDALRTFLVVRIQRDEPKTGNRVNGPHRGRRHGARAVRHAPPARLLLARLRLTWRRGEARERRGTREWGTRAAEDGKKGTSAMGANSETRRPPRGS